MHVYRAAYIYIPDQLGRNINYNGETQKNGAKQA